MMKSSKLLKTETFLLKGIGILLIVFHNFFHIIKPTCGENEFSFASNTFKNFINNITLHNSISYFFTYFGHYGVQVFIFLSGYGLSVAYLNKNVTYSAFLKKRILKLYPTFTIVLVMILIYKYIILSGLWSMDSFMNLGLRYLLIANWVPGKIFVISGPFWFYSMIFQLYLLFPILLWVNKKNKYALFIIAIISFLFTIYYNSYFVSLKLSLYFNFAGNLPLFILGMLFAHKNEFKLKIVGWLLFIILFIAGQFFENLWYFSQISFIVILFPIILKLYNKYEHSYLSNFLIITGKLSMYMFAVNGFMRGPWMYFLKHTNNEWSMYLFALFHIILVYLLALIVRKVEQQVLFIIEGSRGR